MDFALPHKVGHYTLTQRLGQGGMGVVYRARDERLGRDVALKMIAGLSDDAAIKRFWREARAAAAVSHPNVCQIFEVDESPDGIYLAMELLAGEPLDARLGKSACSPRDAVKIALEMLGALSALHELGFVHRDIKPSNVFLTPHGVKVLDFGLARPISENTVRIEPATITDQITKPGMMIGTPRYMAPEQIRGQIVDQRADIYAVGTVLFEMLAGRAPFMSENVFDLAQAVLNDHPPALQGPASVIAIDRVIRRALAKDAAARFPLAKAMAAELSSIVFESTSTEGVSAVRALLRVVVPPLRLAREDSDAQFLSYGLAEAVSGSLAGLRDLVVRSPALAAKWSATDSDPRQLAHQADVDVVVSGTLQRMGDQLRAQMQAVEAKSGTVLGAASIRGTMAEIFAFEDQLTQGVIGLLTPLRADSGKQDAVRRDVPANGRAFELFLRGIELARDMSRSMEARAVFQEALEHDPAFAPAWAWLARCHRVIGKYMEDYEGNDRRADEAFRRALALSPDLPVVHRFYTHYESERGRSDAAVSRLLQQAKSHRNDAQLFAALTHACRYSGLMGASTAAHDEARRLDPTVPTSVEFTYLLLQRMDRLAELGVPNVEAAQACDALFNGDVPSARKSLETLDLSRLPFGYRVLIDLLLARNENPAAANAALDQLMASGTASDPEAIFLGGVTAVSVGLGDRGVSFLRESVARGFTPVHALTSIPVLAKFQQHPGLIEALDTARKRQRIALAVFERGGGPELLGIAPEAAL